jgi:hypothetical protein
MRPESALSEMENLVADLDSRSPDRIISTVRRRQEISESLDSYYNRESVSFPDFGEVSYDRYRELTQEFDTKTRKEIIQITLSQTGSADWTMHDAFTEIAEDASEPAINKFLIVSLGANITRLFRDGMMSEVPQEYVDRGFEAPEHGHYGSGALGLCIDTPHIDFKQPFMNFVEQNTIDVKAHISSDRVEKRTNANNSVAKILTIASLANKEKAVKILRETYAKVDGYMLSGIDQLPILRAQHKLTNNEYQFLDEQDPVYHWLQSK